MKYICYEMHFVMMNVRNADVLHADLLVEMIVGKKTGSKTDNLLFFLINSYTFQMHSEVRVG